MPTHEERWRRAVLDSEVACSSEEPVHRRTVEIAGAAPAVGPCEPCEQLEVNLLCEAAERAIAHLFSLAEHAWFQVVRDESHDLRADVEPVDGVNVEPVEHAVCRR